MPLREHTWLHAGIFIVPAAVLTLLAATVTLAACHLFPIGFIALVPAADCNKKTGGLSAQLDKLNRSWMQREEVLNDFPKQSLESVSTTVACAQVGPSNVKIVGLLDAKGPGFCFKCAHLGSLSQLFLNPTWPLVSPQLVSGSRTQRNSEDCTRLQVLVHSGA